MIKVTWVDNKGITTVDYWMQEEINNLYFLEKCGELTIIKEERYI